MRIHVMHHIVYRCSLRHPPHVIHHILYQCSPHHPPHVIHHLVIRCSPRHPPLSVPVLATSSATPCSGARHVIHHTSSIKLSSHDVAGIIHQALVPERVPAVPAERAGGGGAEAAVAVLGRGLHSSTYLLKLSCFCH